MTRAKAARLAAATRTNTTMARRTMNTDIPKLNCTIWVDMVNVSPDLISTQQIYARSGQDYSFSQLDSCHQMNDSNAAFGGCGIKNGK